MLDKNAKKLSDLQLLDAKDILTYIPVYIEVGDYNGAISRAYYAAFHALKALEQLDDFESKKHSGAISFFRHKYVKTGKFDSRFSEIIGRLYEARGLSDYDVAAKFKLIDAQEAFENAKIFVNAIDEYLNQNIDISENENNDIDIDDDEDYIPSM